MSGVAHISPLRAARASRRRLARFARDEAGAIIVFWALAIGAVLAVVALSYDIGRMASTQTEMQSFADQIALAAAGELDGAPTAITRAQAAANSLITRHQSFAQGGQTLTAADVTLSFYSTLPPVDTDPMTNATTDPAEAQYARAVVTPRTISFSILNAANATLGGSTNNTALVGAEAVAGFKSYACDITPMFFCLPNANYRANEHIGDVVLLRSQGGGTAWGPGDFGFLDPTGVPVDPDGVCANQNGANLYQCLVAAEGPITQCYQQRGVDLEPGQMVGLADAAYNTKFDIFTSSMQSARNDPRYPPAPNTISGVGRIQTGGNAGCVQGNPPPTTSAEVPPDDCFGSGTCNGGGSNRFGNGNWGTGRDAYVAANYGGNDPHEDADTRWEYYQAEIAAHGGPGAVTPILNQTLYPTITESGRPQCSPFQSADIYRRTFVAAAVDCTANAINGARRNVPVIEFFELFMLSPARTNGASPPSVDIYAEIIGSASEGVSNGGLFHDMVQLYR